MTLPSIFNTMLLAGIDQTSSLLLYSNYVYEDNLLLETGDDLLLETGYTLILEQGNQVKYGLLQSDGGKLILS
tara:strand:+ start:728 stop:946 length:219 start_codon:yes stop_codon:yes gene_type:complete